VTWPFHDGELAAQRLAGFAPQGGNIRDLMPEQHRLFYAQLPFVILGGVNRDGPIATVLAGERGFITSPDARTLRLAAALDDADPAADALVRGAPAGLLGIELATKRRNRANGTVAAADRDGLVIAVRQAFGNCPQYIHPRELRRGPAAPPAPAERLGGLDAGARAMIAAADTLFVASAARAAEATGGVDVSHRGGPAGFVRVDGDTLTIPDYRGNRYFNTLGNLVAEPRASLLLVGFDDGAVLQLQGAAEIVWDGPEVRAHEGAERLWRVRVERAWRRRGAWPLRGRIRANLG
jgi:predicted pyridoxine 5'-phosphate oxidase superfamily flavin-nucleotide-binding protein